MLKQLTRMGTFNFVLTLPSSTTLLQNISRLSDRLGFGVWGVQNSLPTDLQSGSSSLTDKVVLVDGAKTGAYPTQLFAGQCSRSPSRTLGLPSFKANYTRQISRVILPPSTNTKSISCGAPSNHLPFRLGRANGAGSILDGYGM